jgi:hypothetical protein
MNDGPSSTRTSNRSEPGSILRAVDRAMLVSALLLSGVFAAAAVALRRRLAGS